MHGRSSVEQMPSQDSEEPKMPCKKTIGEPSPGHTRASSVRSPVSGIRWVVNRLTMLRMFSPRRVRYIGATP